MINNASRLTVSKGELQSPTRGGRVHIFGRSVNLIQVVRTEKWDETPALAVLLTILIYGMRRVAILGAIGAALLAGNPAMAAPAVWNVPGNFSTIQAAINAASPGDTILVAPGTYPESIDFGGKNITLKSTSGPAATIIHPTSGRCAQMGPGGSLIGFTLTGGYADWGAGVNTLGSGSLIKGDIFIGNTQETGYYGAAIAGNNSSPVILQNVFLNNTADSQFTSGAVSFVNGSSPTIENNLFENNNCRAIDLTLPQGNQPLVINNTIVGNTVGIRVDCRIPTSSDILRNNLIEGNGVGLEIDFGSAGNYPTWDHNLVFGNTTNYSGIPDQTGLLGNISANPEFVNPLSDFMLKAGSPAIDAGSLLDAPTVDFLNNPRPYDGNPQPSIGAFEFVPEPSSFVLLAAGAIVLAVYELRRRTKWRQRCHAT